jgi:amidohydrolase
MAAKVLSQYKSELKGNVKIIFQPAEEGLGGAKEMVKAGVLDNPKVEAAIGVHLWTGLPVGKIGVRTGATLAAADELKMTIKGKGGHGAIPHQTVDPITVAAQFITLIQTIVSRNVDPLKSAVVSIGKIQGGTAINIIPEEVVIGGTIRTFDPEVRELVLRRLHEVVKGTCQAHGADWHFEVEFHCPALVNDERISGLVKKTGVELLGANNVVEANPTMGSEDMAFMLQEAPGCYFFLGASNKEKGLDQPHHSPSFNFDEEALAIGVEVIVNAVRKYLS